MGSNIVFRIGYWNIHKVEEGIILPFLLNLLNEYDLDLLFLSEHQGLTPAFEQNLPSSYKMVKQGPNCEKVIAIQKNSLDFNVVNDEKRYMLLSSKKNGYSIVGLHLQDNVHNSDYASRDREYELKRILEALNQTRNENEILVGDFNCMPDAPEIANKDGLNAVLFKDELNMPYTAHEKKRFYNPMLLTLNEENKMYGSLRYVADKRTIYWYAYDQVVVSATLANRICNIKYPRVIGGKSLMSSKNINPRVSDHLPLVFAIK